MNISAVSCNNYNNVKRTNKNNCSPNFKGALNGAETTRVLGMLQQKVSAIKPATRVEELTSALDTLMKKWEYRVSNKLCAGMMIIPDENLSGFLGSEASKYNTRDLKGICVAVGDKHGPIESWKTVYESITVLIPKTNFFLGFRHK